MKHDVFVKSEKGVERVGALEVDSGTEDLAEIWVFAEYTRDARVMRAEPEGALGPESKLVSVNQCRIAEGKIADFHGFLKSRSKAAIARHDGFGIVMLPVAPTKSAVEPNSISLAVYSLGSPPEEEVEPAKKKMKRSKNPLLQRLTREEVGAFVDEVPVYSPESKEKEADAMVFRDPEAQNAVFYQDARRRYEFRCGRPGLELLVCLWKRTNRILKLNAAELSEFDPTERDRLVKDGKRIYGEKPSLRGKKGEAAVTWSDAEYAHVGLRTQYLTLKSVQRFTETYNLGERASAYDENIAFIFQKKQHLRLASLGGGPAFELDALRELAYAQQPDVDIEFDMYSIDLQPAWKPYAEALGCKFVAPFDVSTATVDSLLAACGGKPVDLLVISYLLIYCTDERCADLLADFLRRNLATAIMISERTHKQDIAKMLQERGLDVLNLMPQKRAIDQRQMLVMLPAKRRRPQTYTDPEPKLLFPNVPFAKGT